MRYVCTVWQDEGRMEALAASGYAALVLEARAYDEELRATGRLVAAHVLAPARQVVTIRDGRLSDAPQHPPRVHLGAILVLDARDLNEAIQLAARLPPARLGWVEVRPLASDDIARGRGG